MKNKYAGLQYWLLYTAIWIGVIIILRLDLNEEYSIVLLGIGCIVAGYITGLIAYNLEGHFKYIFRKNFSNKSRLGISTRSVKKPRFRFRMIPDFSTGK